MLIYLKIKHKKEPRRILGCKLKNSQRTRIEEHKIRTTIVSTNNIRTSCDAIKLQRKNGTHKKMQRKYWSVL